jgi:hypothetical protein
VFTNLNANKKYDFSVQSVCPNKSKSDFVTKSVKTASCSLPDDVTAFKVTDSSFVVEWDNPCPVSNAYIKMKSLNGPWLFKALSDMDSVYVTGVNHDSTYIYQICTCSDTANNWTPAGHIRFFHTTSTAGSAKHYTDHPG